ncbi:hypothetical protein WJ0W_001634 [Paenibacillus melissococcoides]|uniref:Uncharacterized protein n=1 Tax=Paenibacillus melissococcoides TaxID=2912268 RepID=A0ABM9FYZ2_9BACL|nr:MULTISPECIES: hypothetical protein [Paenibacillus]MEB9893414.1 hypothetical protein [Bacillus cereus]CAH8244397.1 hypothetical protein WJ0W_001634 [Paenibacillus melissococcoides]CAH8703290.1 hypothetical protein HTL2_000037 [Paenibacillus melissococcoides]CAH8705642.1 hypothetical protein WDD9_000997 [Paenibacillus melissococcoides]GIO80802.1 hypothetical protein J6TS7_44120 [Paenibacillus dendritiformis]
MSFIVLRLEELQVGGKRILNVPAEVLTVTPVCRPRTVGTNTMSVRTERQISSSEQVQ